MKLVLAFCGGMAFVVTIAVVAMIRANAEDADALIREYYQWWTVNASRKHLKLGPIAFSFDQEFAICLWCRWTIGVMKS